MNKMQQTKSKLVQKGWTFTECRVQYFEKATGKIKFTTQTKWKHPELAPDPIGFTKAVAISFPPLKQLPLFNEL